jgi:hypothetical protein
LGLRSLKNTEQSCLWFMSSIVLSGWRVGMLGFLLCRGHMEHFLFGRANEELIRKMPCSIMLVKREETGE